MTFVEFFDNDPIKNVSSAMLYSPERVILVGKNNNLGEKYKKRYERVFDVRKENGICDKTVEFQFRCTSQQTLQGYVQLLTDIVETYDDCVFDVDGGDQLMMVAFGVVYERYRDKNIRLHRFNPLLHKECDCDEDGVFLEGTPTKLTVEEVVRLHGGGVVYSDVHGEHTYRWDMNPDFRNDIELMWSFCRNDTRRWNVQIGVFQAAKTIGRTSADGLTVTADLMSVEMWLDEKGWKYKIDSDMIRYLEQHELIADFKLTAHSVSLTFKNLQVKRCLTKSGTAFEMFVYSTIRSLTDQNGAPMYDDVVNGVFIDWDGVLHDDSTDNVCDTENEIDVMMTHGFIPIFLSCKSGKIEKEELYKLHTVARRFGGAGAKMVLATTNVENEYLRQRMRDMGIHLIEKVHLMDSAKAAKAFRKLWAKNVTDGAPKK